MNAMVVANLFKGSSSFLFTRCNSRRPLILATAPKPNCFFYSNGFFQKTVVLTIAPRFSPPSITAGRYPDAANKRKCLCTAAPSSSVSDSSSAAATAPVPVEADANEESEESRMMKVKDAANTLDIRVGRILRAWRHEEADSLYVEEVDVGEAEPRTICSGLVKYVPLEELQNKNVIVLANLKPRNMRGVKSNGMLMAASDESHENVELLEPPEDSVPGERIWFGSSDENENLPETASPNQTQKKKIWELVQPHLRTDESCDAALHVHYMRTARGVVGCRSLKNARIS